MNKPIRTISVFCLLLFVALMINATYLQYYEADALNADKLNKRVIDAAYSRERGSILVDRTEIAKSIPSGDQYDYKRTYPEPYKYAPITGWYTLGNATGIERSQNSVLSGDDAKFFVTRMIDLINNNDSKGGNVELTIDPAAQNAAYDGLKALPGVQGAVVAIEPSTGRILAMASYPSYDPNKLASHDFAAANKESDRLNLADSEPLLNRAVGLPLAPGSTFKLVTAAAAIESGNYTASSNVPGGATYQLPETTGSSGLIDNEGRDCGTGQIPFAQAMENSCNTTFAQLAVQVGAEAMIKQAEKFGFNSDSLEDLPGVQQATFPTKLNKPQTGQTGIGQYEVRATPLQMAMVAAGIANNGVVMKPYLVDKVLSPDLDVLDQPSPEQLSEAVSPETATELGKLLVATVQNGTASGAAIPNVVVAGKTGTAQTGDPAKPPYAWFVSYAPAGPSDTPKVAVAVMIQKVDVPRDQIAGGALGAPIAKAVMEAVLQR